MSKPDKLCYLCGKTESELAAALTKDHIIADCFFPQPKPPNLLTLPCCVDCQKEYGIHEEYLRNSLSAISDAGGNPDALKSWKTTHRSLKRRVAMYTDFKNRMSPLTVGNYVFQGLSFSQERTEKVIQKIIKGLHYHHTKERLPENASIEIHYQPKEILEDLLKTNTRFKGRYGNSCSYAAAYAEEGDSIWWLTFYKSNLFIAIVKVTPDADGQSNGDQKPQQTQG
jgi:hypothetical protein